MSRISLAAVTLGLLLLLYNVNSQETPSLDDDPRCSTFGGRCAETHCCPQGRYVHGACQMFANQECCLATPDCTWRELTWPEGSFALPRSVYDCPSPNTYNWTVGETLLQYGPRPGDDLGGDLGEVSSSGDLHLLGTHSGTSVSFMTCALVGDGSGTGRLRQWPPGSYCVYKIAETCPPDMQTSTVAMTTDVNVDLLETGPSPWRHDRGTTSVSFCCMANDTLSSEDVYLPSTAPFVMIKKGDTCQAVTFMKVKEEYVRIPVRNGTTLEGAVPATVAPSGDHEELTLKFCVYVAEDSCYRPNFYKTQYAGSVDVSVPGQEQCTGPCSTSTSRLSMTGLEPACVSWPRRGSECGIPKCDLEAYTIFKERILVRTSHGTNDDSLLAVDSLLGTCSIQNEVAPWWQADLGRVVSLGAVDIYTDRLGPDSAARQRLPAHAYCMPSPTNDVSMEVTIGMADDDFLSGRAPHCIDQSRRVPLHVTTSCVQPVTGRCLTMRRTDTIHPPRICLSICNVDIYVVSDGTNVQLDPYIITESGPVITTADYRLQLGQQRQSTWLIEAAGSESVQLTVHAVRLVVTPTEKNSTYCQDQVIIVYHGHEGTDDVALHVTSESVFISPHSNVSITLRTCYNPDLRQTDDLSVDVSITYEPSDCPGCGMQEQCGAGLHCGGPCGYISSPGYPAPGSEHRTYCRWLIHAQHPQHLVQLQFIFLNVSAEDDQSCLGGYVTAFHVSENNQVPSLIGRYCNRLNLPDQVISKGIMEIQYGADRHMMTSGGKTGFLAKYRSIESHQNDTVEVGLGQCGQGWTVFGDSCYQVRTVPDGLTWINAKYLCEDDGSHLVHIKSAKVSEFVQGLLLDVLGENSAGSRVYIGLGDSELESMWRWTDDTPVSYSNWLLDTEIKEPNGLDLENCASTRVGEIDARAWEDTPCAYPGIHHYMCQYRNATTASTRVVDVNMVNKQCAPDLFQCGSLECIQWVSVCDRRTDCTDSSDEQACSYDDAMPDDDISSECSTDQYKCASGQCVHWSLYCDFKDDCPDASDERYCVRPDMEQCEEGEFTCTSGQCIEVDWRCDGHSDCYDNTDEDNCELWTSENTFQCYDGSVIRRTRLCDGVRDCFGNVGEDEDIVNCAQTQLNLQTCADYRRAGYSNSGEYTVFSDTAAIVATCEMGASDTVTTVFADNLLARTSKSNIQKMLSKMARCEQALLLSYVCGTSGMLTYESWVDSSSQPATFGFGYFHGASPYCWFSTTARSRCECESLEPCVSGPPLQGAIQAYIMDKDRLPILYPSYFGIAGPLRCYQDFEGVPSTFPCANEVLISESLRCLYDIDEYGILKGCRDATHLVNCDDYVCPEGFAKCPSSYCVAVRLLCDGQLDCPEGEDERNCESSPCPAAGMYGCLKFDDIRKCVRDEERCDGKRQCPGGDDEWYCDITCPVTCQCRAFNVDCALQGIEQVPSVTNQVRSLNFSGNTVELFSDTFMNYTSLGQLDLSQCNLSSLPIEVFQFQVNLYLLDLSNNNLKEIVQDTFSSLHNLVTLKLVNNLFGGIYSGSFYGLESLPSLSLRNLELPVLYTLNFEGMSSLTHLDVSDSEVVRLELDVFNGLPNLQSLNISQNDISAFDAESFSNLSSLAFLQSDDYSFCCFAGLLGGKGECLPEKDEFSSCEDLMSNATQRTFMWLLGWVALLGNLFVFIWRTLNEEKGVSAYLVKYLSVADFLMGVYMISIASVDTHYRGRYIEHATWWKNSGWCAALGGIATISSEASVFTLFAITADRLITIVTPFSSWRLTVKKARYILVAIWVLATAIALVPMLPTTYFDGKFYSRSGVCVSLHITDEATPGWEYSVAVFHGLNLFAFTFIFLAYGFMHETVKKGMLDKKKEMSVARRMTVIVFTDFCCWVPINIMGILAMSGVHIPGDVYVWTVVFILPFNSALNPVLYTFSYMKAPWKGSPGSTGKQGGRRLERGAPVSLSMLDNAGCRPLVDILSDPALADMKRVLILTRKATAMLGYLHQVGLAVSELDASSFLVRDWPQDSVIVSLKAYPLPQAGRLEDKAENILQLAKVISRLMRAHTARLKTKGIGGISVM